MIYLITHGDRFNGSDPIHTPDGLRQINSLPIPQDVKCVVSGTGRRFLEILGIVRSKLPYAPFVKYSPFCGGTEGYEVRENKELIILTDGRTVDYRAEYVGVSNGPLDMWMFVSPLPDKTLLCAGGDLLIGLGLKDIYEKGHLYELDPATRTGRKIA